jgi:excisionase family DNA binding protein
MYQNPFEDFAERLSRIEHCLLDLKTLYKGDNSDSSTQKPYTVPQAAEYLNLAVPTIYSMVSRKEIAHFKKNKRLYFSKEDLDSYIASGRKKTISEIEAEAVANLPTPKRKKA